MKLINEKFYSLNTLATMLNVNVGVSEITEDMIATLFPNKGIHYFNLGVVVYDIEESEQKEVVSEEVVTSTPKADIFKHLIELLQTSDMFETTTHTGTAKAVIGKDNYESFFLGERKYNFINTYRHIETEDGDKGFHATLEYVFENFSTSNSDMALLSVIEYFTKVVKDYVNLCKEQCWLDTIITFSEAPMLLLMAAYNTYAEESHTEEQYDELLSVAAYFQQVQEYQAVPTILALYYSKSLERFMVVDTLISL